jgi:hypothetical protein
LDKTFSLISTILTTAPTKGELSCKSTTLPFKDKLQSCEKTKPVANSEIPATDLVKFEQQEQQHFFGSPKNFLIIIPKK